MNRLNLPWQEWAALARGAGLAAAGAALAYLASALPGCDRLGPYGPLVGALASVLLNYVRKLATAPPADPAP